MDSMKILMVIFDGIGDRPVPSLKNLTPLQHAKAEELNRLAKEGVCGIMDTIGPGIRPGSDTAHLAMLGYDPYKTYTGRGPFEAAGIGLELQPGDIALRCNFATVDDKLRVIDRRAGRIREGTEELAKVLNEMDIDGVRILFKPGVEHRGVLVLRGKALSQQISDIDPHTEMAIVEDSKPLMEEGRFTASVLSKFVRHSYSLLKDHTVNLERIRKGEKPANIILARGAGIVPHIQNINEKYKMKTASVVGIPLIKGICRILGMECIEVEGATGGIDTDMKAKGMAAVRMLDMHDFVLLNIKAPDIYGHDGNARGKVNCILQLDMMMRVISKNISEKTLVALCSDHSTPITVKDHSADPVPLAICGPGVRIDDVKSFDEVNLARGGLGRIRGMDLMHILLDLANRSEKFGS